MARIRRRYWPDGGFSISCIAVVGGRSFISLGFRGQVSHRRAQRRASKSSILRSTNEAQIRGVSDHSQGVSKALVLAAGNGTRLKSATPKPVLHLLGVPLLARTLFTLERSGITDAYVVLGYEADRIKHEIERISMLKIRVHWLYNDRWKRPDGLSVLAGESMLPEPFILTMADHVFESSVVTTLRENAHRLQGIELAVDYDVDRVSDVADATKVRLESDRIVAIGKTLPSYDAIDTGVFLASPALFAAVREACDEGEAALSDGVQRLADAGMARATDIGGRMWHDIDTLEEVSKAERKLLASVGKATDGPISRHINRPISTALSRRLVNTPLTPNQISVGNLAISLVSAALAALGGYLPFLLSGILFQIASVLDGTDGEIAKLTFRTSRRGEWIDTVCDQVSYFAFLVGLVVGVYRSQLPDFYFLAGILGLVSASLSMMAILFYLLRHKGSGSALTVQYGFQNGTGILSRVLRMVQYLGKRDMFAFLVLVLAVIGQLPMGLVLFGFGATFVLLPATIRANLPAFRQPSAAPQPRRPAPVFVAQHEPTWLASEAPEPVSEPAAS